VTMPPTPFTISACVEPHDAHWLALRRQLFAHHADAVLLAEMARLCAQPGRYAQFIATGADGKPLGFAEVSLRTDHVVGTRSSPVAFLEAIFVVKAVRRQGLARALAVPVRAWARSRDCVELASDALLDNAASHAMHRALGFEEATRLVCFRQSLDA
jgi:aminoglycoside 6'-N-acetyltransferase I